MLGIEAEYEHFDQDIIMHINSVFMDLQQIGVGPSEGFIIEDDISTWNDFLPKVTNFQAIKSYMYLRVRLLFDPPSSSTVVEAMKRDIDKWEWRFSVASDMNPFEEETKFDYNDLENLPTINGQPLIGNYDEKDPTVKPISKEDIADLWNE
jgi:hypothetical protein